MAQSYVTLPSDVANTGKQEDHWVTSLNGYYREGVVIADPSTDAAVAPVVNADPSTSAYGLVVRLPNTNPLDYDTGAGSVPQMLVGIGLPGSGGPTGVSQTNPLPVTQGTLTGSTPAQFAVTNTSAEAVAANSSRKALFLTNSHTSLVVWIAFGATAVIGRGIPLYAGGGSFGPFPNTTQAVNAIGATEAGVATSGANLAIQEWT